MADVNEKAGTIPEKAIELLPCPFCGSEAKVLTARVSEDCEEARVECTSCAAAGPADEDAYANHAAAVSYWNRRLALPPLRAQEEIARIIKKHVYAHPDSADKALAFVDDESIAEAADAILSRTAGQEWREPEGNQTTDELWKDSVGL